jgi:uncharacterized protein YndB with AHSA1/START domain/ADP-ribose pyrophosphatase YjhB (NUDIX family)
MEPIIKRISIDAPISKVWIALTDPAILGKWITMPNNISPVVGNEFTFEAESRDEWGNWDRMIKCKITELIPGKKISYTWASELIKGETIVSFELNDNKGKTELTLIHSGWENLPENAEMWKESHNKGWRDLLSRLGQSLSEKKAIKLICDVALLLNDKYSDEKTPELKTLLVKYTDTNKYDLQKGWFIPDDGIIHGEHPDDASLRILKEQLGVEGFEPALGFIESFTGGDKSWHLVFHYYIVINEHVKLTNEKLKGVSDHVIKMKKVILNPVEDIAEMKWFPVNSLPDRKEIAHGGWAMFTIEEILSKINT